MTLRRLADLRQLVGQRRVDDDHADGIFWLDRKLSGLGFFNVLVRWGRLYGGIICHFKARICLLNTPLKSRGRRHRLTGNDGITHAMQFVHTLLQQVVHRPGRFNALAIDRDQQGFNFVTQVTHRGDAGHSRAALQRMQMALQFFHRFFGRLVLAPLE